MNPPGAPKFRKTVACLLGLALITLITSYALLLTGYQNAPSVLLILPKLLVSLIPWAFLVAYLAGLWRHPKGTLLVGAFFGLIALRLLGHFAVDMLAGRLGDGFSTVKALVMAAAYALAAVGALEGMKSRLFLLPVPILSILSQLYTSCSTIHALISHGITVPAYFAVNILSLLAVVLANAALLLLALGCSSPAPAPAEE